MTAFFTSLVQVSILYILWFRSNEGAFQMLEYVSIKIENVEKVCRNTKFWFSWYNGLNAQAIFLFSIEVP